MIKPTGVVHFSLPVSDLAVSRDFYTRIVGLTLVADAPAHDMVFLKAGNDHVILCKSGTPIVPNPPGSRRMHHAFGIDASRYEAAKEFLKQSGVEVFDEEDRKEGVFVGRQFYFRDPDNNVIEFSDWTGAR